MKIKPIVFLILILLSISFGCKKEKVPQENIKVKIGRFDEDSAFVFIEKQVSFGKRYMNTSEHEDCKNWLIKKLEAYDLQVIPQTFEAKSYNGINLKGTNIIGRYKPEIKERMLICAHYDTRHIADRDSIDREKPIDGADDGGSGVGVILEIARQIQNNPIPMGLDIVFFDAEDYGDDKQRNDYSWGLGSQYWAKNLHEEDYEVKYGILLDMVGSKNATFPKEGFSMQTAPNQVNKMWKFAKQMGYSNFFVNKQIGSITDDHRFIIEYARIPMIDIINVKSDGKFGHYHHTHSDNIEIIDKKTLKAVGQIVLAIIYKESNKEN
jgi:glutaminyl-peptide cyclotransferase